MIGLIDTNLFVYATAEAAPEHSKARAFLEKALAGSETYGITWINIGEYLSLVTQPFGGQPPLLPKERAVANVESLLEMPTLKIITEGESHWDHLRQILKEAGTVKGSFVHDCRIAAIMKENGVGTIFTRDADFRKIPGLKVVDPI